MNHGNGGKNGLGTATALARNPDLHPEESEAIDTQREQRIEELRALVHRGEYTASAQQVARKIIDEHLS